MEQVLTNSLIEGAGSFAGGFAFFLLTTSPSAQRLYDGENQSPCISRVYDDSRIDSLPKTSDLE